MAETKAVARKTKLRNLRFMTKEIGNWRRVRDRNYVSGSKCHEGHFPPAVSLHTDLPSSTLFSSHASTPQNPAVEKRKPWRQSTETERICWQVTHAEEKEKQ